MTDPLARLIDQGQTAAELEQIRELYARPLAAVEAHEGFTDVSQIPMLWTFTIVDAGEVTFDPANQVIPFPNDILRTSGLVALPNPLTGQPLSASDCAAATDPTVTLYCGLNTLDGFSTIAAPISENGLADGAVAQATIDPTTLTTPATAPPNTLPTIGLVVLASAAPPEEQTTPEYAPCLNCLSSTPAAGTTPPQQLQWQLIAPLDEKTTYLAYVTTDVKDTSGKNVIANPVFALVRSKNPIAIGGKSQVSVISDAQATQLEPLRLALEPALDSLEAGGVPRTKIALAWAFTTQSEATLLDQMYAYPATATNLTTPPLAAGAIIFADATAQYTAAAGTTIPIGAIGKFYSGVFETPFSVTGPGGTFNGAGPLNEPVTFALALPAAPPPAGGYPLTIFGHGLGRDRNDFLLIANSLATAGQATIATDVVFHGERTSCTGSGAFVAAVMGVAVSDEVACADPLTMICNEDPYIGRCVARNSASRIACPGLGVAGPDPTGNLGCQAAGLGACVGGLCEGGDFARDSTGKPILSGWNIFSLSNFFATRDNFRQQVIDLSELVNTLHVAGPTSIATLAGTTFDLTKLGYVGQSLGGILGTLFNAVSPETNNVVLNVPGGDLTQIILQAPSFAPQATALVNALGAQGIAEGTPAFDQFIATAQWIVDPADPANMGWRLTHTVTPASGAAAPNANREALIQFIEGDQTVPNVTNLALVAAANRMDTGMPPSFGCTGNLACYEFTEAGEGFDATSVPLSGRHGFLLAPPATTQPPSPQAIALTTKAQKQVALFLATGAFTPNP